MQIQQIKAVLFDLDGTLIDSEPSYWKAWRSVFLPLGINLSDADLRSVMGMRPPEVAATFLDRFRRSEVAIDKKPNDLAHSMLAHMANDSHRTLMPGAREAVELARSVGLATAIATSAPQSLASAALKATGLTELFDVVVSSQHEKKGKPDPAVFLTAARKLSVQPQQCVVVEDAVNGVVAAKAVGMRCILVPEIGQDHPRFAQADVRLSSLEHLKIEHFVTTVTPPFSIG